MKERLDSKLLISEVLKCVFRGKTGDSILALCSNTEVESDLSLGKGGISKSDEFLEKFQKGGGGHFQSKNLCCRFLPL